MDENEVSGGNIGSLPLFILHDEKAFTLISPAMKLLNADDYEIESRLPSPFFKIDLERLGLAATSCICVWRSTAFATWESRLKKNRRRTKPVPNDLNVVGFGGSVCLQ